MKNHLWFKGDLESGTVVYESSKGLVVVRGLTEEQVDKICDAHNAAIKAQMDRILYIRQYGALVKET